MKRFTIFVVAVCLTLVFAIPVQAEEITIVGTGSGEAILKAIGTALTTDNPSVTVSVPKSIGSGGGIKAVGTDVNLIGRVARGIKEKEKHYGLTYHPIAKMPIVFFVNKSVGIKDLSIEQVCDIYSGKITNWKDVGGKDVRIRVIRREDGDSSLGVLLKTLPGFADITITSKSKTTYSDPETFELVTSKADTIAFGTYGNAQANNVEILTIGGKSAGDSSYPYTGTLALIFKDKNNTGAIKQFIEFTASAKAQEAILEAGGLPL